MAQVAVMAPDGQVEKIERDGNPAALTALRQMAALMLKAALQHEFDGIRLGAAVAEDDQ